MARTFATALMVAACTIALGVAGSITAEAAGKAQSNSPVTMSGCLRADGGNYILTNLKGNQVITRRNWKTAYITKTTKNHVVLSPAVGVNLRNQVDRQVTVVGVVDGSRLATRSIKRVAASCAA
jgi:hypothetical protein